MNVEPNFNLVKQELDAVGCGFCLAKWTQVTIHLGSGLTHSCHHVGAHKIPLEELKNNPGALHNTREKKKRRKEMLNGLRPDECDYCWRIEDNTTEFSDRIIKSSLPWSEVDKEKIIDSPWDKDIYPRYVEISFGNVCNFKCTYCGPAFSSKWAEEINSAGPYKVRHREYNKIKESEIPIPNRDYNPYIEAFWKWFPEAIKHMKVFRITGGEPLLSKHTHEIIQFLIDNPHPEVELAINSNACPPKVIWEKFVDKIEELENKNCVKEFILYTSAESYAEQAEYSRDGMDWVQFDNNLRLFIKNTKKSRVVFMSAFNILSLPSLIGFIRYVDSLKRITTNNYIRVYVDFAYVRHPEFLDIKIATKDLIERYLKTTLDYMVEKRLTSQRFQEYEIMKLDRIYKDCMNRFEKQSNVTLERHQFWTFIKEYDLRRSKNFINTFPEYKEFYELCGSNYV
tara:strand:- start:154 stop:1515 length:1362 start_codon:yes stop_codon:yes gene_type:complete